MLVNKLLLGHLQCRKAAAGHARAWLQDPTGAYVRALKRPDGVELYVRDFLVHSGTQAKGLVVMVHGWSWHSRYFQPAAEHFTQQGATLASKRCD